MNNYKKKLIQRLSLKPRLNNGISKLDNLLKDLYKKKCFKKIRTNGKTHKFVDKLGKILNRKLKEKILNKINDKNNENKNNKNELNKKEIDMIKMVKKLKRNMNNCLKRYAFEKLKQNYILKKSIDKLNKILEKLLKKIFMYKLKEIKKIINELYKIEKIMDKKKFENVLDRLREISESTEGKENQKRVRYLNLFKLLKKLLIDKDKKEAFIEMKKIYNDINASNILEKLMLERYKKRLLYLINLIYIYNRPKTNKINSRYPLFNMTDLSSKIDKLILTKIKKKFINELKLIKKIDKNIFYMFLTIKDKIKKEVFDALKTMYFINVLQDIINKLKKKEFMNELKNIKNKVESTNNDKLENNKEEDKTDKLKIDKDKLDDKPKDKEEELLNDLKEKEKEMGDEPKKEDNNENNIENNNEPNKEINNENNIENNNEPNKEINNENNKEINNEPNNEPNKENNNEPNKEINNEPNNEPNKENNNENNKEINNEPNNEPNKEINNEPNNEPNKENDNDIDNEREEKIGELFKKWEENTDKNKILSGLIGNKKDKNKLKEYLEKLNDITTKKKIEDELRKLSKLRNVINILENKERELTKECLNDLKNKVKSDNKIKDEKIKRENKYKEPKKQEKIYKRKYNSQKKRNMNNDDYNKKERIKKRKVRRNITKSRANQKLLEKAFEKWRNNIQKLKSVEDFKQVIDGIKNINNNKKETYRNRNDISNKALFKKIKKASIYLLLDIYKKNRNFILKKYFNKWIKKVNLINKKINEERKDYYPKEIYDSNRKENEKENEKYNDIYKDKKKMKLIGKKGSKVFTKKKTKLNLYKERINLYNSYKQKLLSNSNLRDDGDEDYYYINKSNTERVHYINDSYSSIIKPNKKAFKYSVEPSYTIEEAIEELENNPYKSKSIEKRRLKNDNKLMHINVNENSDEEGLPMESIENRYPYESRIELEDKNYLSNIINLNKSYSSINDSTSNHFTLIEESNEIRNPIKPNVDYHNNNNISRSLKNRNRNKLRMFTISIPKGNNEEKVEFNINYNNLNDRNLITPKKKNNYNFYSNIKTNDKTNNKKNINNSQYLVTSPSDDYFINWEEGNSMCSRIIKNEPSQDNINPNYSSLTNSAQNRKIFMHNKCKSALYNIPENERLKYRNNRKRDLENSRKKLFY